MIARLKAMFAVMKELRAARREGATEEEARMRAFNVASGGLMDEADDTWIELSDDAVDYLLQPPSDDLWPETFTLTPPHVEMIRRARLGWNGAEVGAPQFDTRAPYVGATALELAQGADDMSKAAFLVALVPALRRFMDEATLSPGRYTLRNVDAAHITEAGQGLEGARDLFAIGDDLSVDVTAEDIKLARNAEWEWPYEEDMDLAMSRGEVAGPTVNPKRPYGDMTFYQLDIHRALGWPTEKKTDDGFVELTDAQIDEGSRLHFRQLGVMQAFLENAVWPGTEGSK